VRDELEGSGPRGGVIALLGAGGHEFAGAHVRETARLINELPLGRHDFIYFSPLVIYPQSRYEEQTKALKMAPLVFRRNARPGTGHSRCPALR